MDNLRQDLPNEGSRARGYRNSLHFWAGGVGILYTCDRLAAFLECLPCGTGGLRRKSRQSLDGTGKGRSHFPEG